MEIACLPEQLVPETIHPLPTMTAIIYKKELQIIFRSVVLMLRIMVSVTVLVL